MRRVAVGELEESEGEARLGVCVALAFDASVGAGRCWVAASRAPRRVRAAHKLRVGGGGGRGVGRLVGPPQRAQQGRVPRPEPKSPPHREWHMGCCQ